MDRERWRHIEKLYESVVERSPADRAALLAQADPDIREEVEVLLAQPTGGALLDQPAADLLGESGVTQLPAGTRLGHYQIEAMLGRGGMGVVYRAKDTQLGRQVAIKVLPDALAQDPDRLARFNREAKVLASLNHPNIGHIYGVESLALVMELVEGETLASLIKPGPLPIETALNYARQIVEAIEAAHEKGIIHRDLKPANIMVTPAGLVKVLDFGLAKAEEPPAGGDPMESPTATLSRTRAGLILGTAAYMSPEQASGKIADRRADIWSFGAVLFEMLSGQRAFAGESASDTLASVLKLEPDWNMLPVETPASIRRLIRRCLTKDRKQRLQAIGEGRIELEAALAEGSAPESAIIASLIKRHKKVAMASIAVVVALVPLLLLAATRVWPIRGSSRPVMSAAPLTSYLGRQIQPALSPDGKQVAFAWDGERGENFDIYVQLVNAGAPLRLTSNPADEYEPAWSPDGRYIAFCRTFPDHAETWMIPALGGARAEIGRVDGVRWTILVSQWEVPGTGRQKYAPSALEHLLCFRSRQATSEESHRRRPNISWISTHASLRMVRISRLSETLNNIYVLPVTDAGTPAGEPRLLIFDEHVIAGFDWTRDGRRIVYATIGITGSATGGLWAIGASGGTPEQLSVAVENAGAPVHCPRR